MTTTEINDKAHKNFPDLPAQINEYNAYIKGYMDALNDMASGSKNFFESLASSLRELWPSGEKDGKYPWRDSVSNLTKRLELLWKERGYKDKYTVDDCLMAARRYLAQFEDNAKYMQTLKYFIFKQTKLVASGGKVTYIYKSTFADLLESNPIDISQDWEQAFEADSTLMQGELI